VSKKGRGKRRNDGALRHGRALDSSQAQYTGQQGPGAHREMAKLSLALALALLQAASAFHDCIQPKSRLRLPPNLRHLPLYRAGSVAGGPELPAGAAPANCSGGLCVGMHNGPHEGGPASYPVGNAANGFTGVSSTMTVPGMPEKIDGICERAPAPAAAAASLVFCWLTARSLSLQATTSGPTSSLATWGWGT